MITAAQITAVPTVRQRLTCLPSGTSRPRVPQPLTSMLNMLH
jgi:hypothetical protein